MRRHWAGLFVTVAIYLVFFAHWYNSEISIEDEVGFVNQALVWSRGTVSASEAGYPHMADFVDVKGRLVGWRNPGRSLTLLPFIIAGMPRAIFWSGAVIHIATTIVAASIFRGAGRSPLWALLVLTHPTLALYSRTIMADELAGLFVCLAVATVAKLPRPGLWAGLALGLAALCRYQVAVVVPFVGLALWQTDGVERPVREIVKFFAAAAAVGAALWCYNVRVLGSPIGPTHQGYFAWRFILPHAGFYGACLLAVWPGMLPTLLNPHRLRAVSVAMCVPFVAFLLPYYFHDTRPSLIESAVVGQRLISPVIPVWIVCYGLSAAALLEYSARARWWRKTTARAVFVAMGCGLLAGTGLLFHRHQRFVEGLADARREASRVIPDGAPVLANSTLAKLFGVPWPGERRYHFLRDVPGEPVGEGGRTRAEFVTWYLALLPKAGGSLDPLTELAGRRHRLTPLTVHHPALRVFRCERLPTP